MSWCQGSEGLDNNKQFTNAPTETSPACSNGVRHHYWKDITSEVDHRVLAGRCGDHVFNLSAMHVYKEVFEAIAV